MGDPDRLWYFAYGSNLDPATFLGRRGMRPGTARVAWLAGQRLVFDLPIGRGERGVANLLADPHASVCGVAYRISEDDGRRLDRSEGVPRAYRRVAVEVTTSEGKTLAAFTYVSPHRSPGRRPSERYLNLLLRGARHHGLPADYVAGLRRIELAVDERPGQMELFARAARQSESTCPTSGRARPSRVSR